MGFDKDKYWKNRKEGKRGQDVESAPAKVTPSPAPIAFTNDGTMVLNTREYRRQRTSLFPKTRQLRKRNFRKK